jgi:hypothetical protein
MLVVVIFLIVAAVIAAILFRPQPLVRFARAALSHVHTRQPRQEVEEPKYQHRERSTLEAQFDQAARELRQQRDRWELEERQREQQRQQEQAARDEQVRMDWQRGYDDGLAGRPFQLPEGRMGRAILDYSRGYDEGEMVRERRA